MRSGIVLFVVMLKWSVWMCHSFLEHCMKLSQHHYNGKEFFATKSVFQLGIIEFAGPEGHRFIVLDNVSSHLISGGISVNVKGFIVIGVNKEAILCH